MAERLKMGGYRRVSTAGQVDRYGLPAQLTDLRSWAGNSGHRLAMVKTDGALSGTLPAEERPALAELLAAIKAGRIDALLLPGDLDRLSRELIVQEAILAQVWKSGGRVFTTTRGEILADDPDDPMRTALRQFMGVIAQLDRAMVAKRMRNGRKAKAAAGGYAGYGSPHFGARAEGHELVSDDREQAAVARMRVLQGDGLSLRQIAAQLDAEGIAPKRGGCWYPQTVARVLARAS